MTNNVTIVNGKLTATKEETKPNGKPSKYPYPSNQYDNLLKLAKSAGLDIGTTSASKTKAVNSVTRAILEDYIATHSKPKTEQS